MESIDTFPDRDPAERSVFNRLFYRDRRPTWLGHWVSQFFCWWARAGLPPRSWVALEVRDRVSGRMRGDAVVIPTVAGERYIVSMFGTISDWVHNIDAAHGDAVIAHGGSQRVRLVPVAPEERAPVLREYVRVASSGRKHFPLPIGAPLADFAAIAARYPVYRIERPDARMRRPPSVQSTIETFIKRHPLVTFYTLTFSISWGGMLLAIGGPGGLPGTPEQADRLMGIAFSLVAGPSVAGLLLTGLVSQRAGLRDLFARLCRWRVGARWYAVALLTSPVLTMTVFFALSWRFSDFPIVTTDHRTSMLLQAIAVGLGGGFLEELGWTGFAIPKLKRRHGVFATGLIAGVLWGAWHFLVNFWYSGANSGQVPLAFFVNLYFLTGVAQLTAYRLLMVWVYDRTESLLVAVLMHASLIVSTTPMLVPTMTGIAFLTWFVALAIALWVAVAAVAVANGGQLSDSRFV